MVHTFTINGLDMALDVNSGALHLPAKQALAAINAIEQAGAVSDDIRLKFDNAVLAEIEELTAKGQLFSVLSEEAAAGERAFAEQAMGESGIVKALCIHIAHDCNLRCKYCFAGEGNYGKLRGIMPFEVGRAAIDFLIDASGNRRNLEIDFFGGEPTLGFDTVKKTVAYAKEREKVHGKNFRFTLTTNGLLLDDDIQDYINQNIDNVVLSLDGRKAVNDRMRGECYEKIVPRFRKMAASRAGTNYYIRGTYTAYNPDFCEDVLHIAELGFGQISVEPVVAPRDAHYALQPHHIPALCAEYEKLVRIMAESPGGFNFFHFMLSEQSPCAAKRVTGCGAGAQYLAVTPEGDLYPCHQFVGSPEFCLGNLRDTTKTPAAEKWRQAFGKCNVHTKPECTGCWAKYFCSGGCAANAYHANSDIMVPDEIGCLLQKKRVECALYLKAVG